MLPKKILEPLDFGISESRNAGMSGDVIAPVSPEWISAPTIPLAEESLRLAIRLRLALNPAERSIAFTGMNEGDLAPTVSQAMALAFSQFAPAQVVLVSAAPAAEPTTSLGLSNVLAGLCTLPEALCESEGGGPWLLPSGRIAADRSALFSSAACPTLFSALASRFKYVLVDAGPLSSPASLLSIALCDTVVVALAAGTHSRTEVLSVQNELARTKARMLGVVLTGAVTKR